MPQLSVLMSVYNGERFLNEAIDSILSQSFEDFEFIIINDGSTDTSGCIIKSYAQQDPRIVAIEQDNQGLVSALNTGIATAKTNLIARMDADDIAHPQRLKKQFQYMQDHPTLLALGSAVHVIDEQGVKCGYIEYPSKSDVRDYLFNKGSPLAHPATMFRKDAVRSVGGYREAYKHAEDYDLWLRLSKQGDIDNLTQALLFYREHSQKISVQNAHQQALVSVVARCTALSNVGATAKFEAITLDTLDLFECDRLLLQWQILDIMTSGLLMSPRLDNIKALKGHIPAKISKDSRYAAARALLKFAAAYWKCKSCKKALCYVWRAFVTDPMTVINLVFSKFR